MDDLDAIERDIRSASAVDKAFADTIRNQLGEATGRFTAAGLAPCVAKKMAERCVRSALDDMQTTLGRWA